MLIIVSLAIRTPKLQDVVPRVQAKAHDDVGGRRGSTSCKAGRQEKDVPWIPKTNRLGLWGLGFGV